MKTRLARVALLAGLPCAAAMAQVQDPSFEATGPQGPAAGAWTQTSTNFGSPLADGSVAPVGQTTRARTGEWWAWFGGIPDRVENASLSQTINPLSGPATLTFYLQATSTRTDAQDTLRINVDSQTILTITSLDVGTGGQYNSPSAYIPVTVPLPDTGGRPFTLTFAATTNGAATAPAVTSYFIDDISISTTTACYANCDSSTVAPVLNALDFNCFLNRFNAALPLPLAQQITAYANCDGSTTAPVLNALDFSCFLNQYRAGCP